MLRRTLYLVTAIAVLVACAGQQALRASQPAEEGAGEAALEQMQSIADRYETALDRWQHEDSELAASELKVLRRELSGAAQDCAERKECDAGRALAVYADLLRRHGEGLVGRSADHAEGPFDEKTAADEGAGSVMLADLPEATETITLLKGRELRDVIAINGPVKAALNEWLTWMRPQLIESFENYQFLRRQMWPEYEAAGLPEAVLFGILAKESLAKVHAVSRVGASGPLQFMPATGARFGLGRDAQGFDTRFDPQLAARANVRYLNERFAAFNNDLAFALAAYNGGEGRLLRIYRGASRKNFWDAALNSRLPAETRDYVPMVLAAAWLFLHPDEYGVVFPNVAAQPAELVLRQVTSVNQLAICLGQEGSRSGWFRALRNLNPRLEPHEHLAIGSKLQVPATVLDDYGTHCVDGERARLAALIANASKRHPSALLLAAGYTVRRGDSIDRIARRHQCGSPLALAASNGIKGPRFMIRPGQTIRLAGCRV